MSTRVAIVTGASSGIGAATARGLAEAGLNVLVNYAGNAEGAAKVVAECEAKGVDAVAVQGDVSDDASCRAIAAAAKDRWGRIDVLINKAGTTKIANAQDLSALSGDDFQQIYSVNVVGAYQMTRAAEAALREGETPAIVNTSSIAGTHGMGSSIAYMASKGALNTMTLALARTFAPQVRVNAVCPGYVASEWWRDVDAATVEKMRARSASIALLQRVASSEDIAEAVLFFALGARAVTGQLLIVDNGMTLNVGQPASDAQRA
ncbi:MAG: SDR family oxidoreductase [Pseudomonadota bacterium]